MTQPQPGSPQAVQSATESEQASQLSAMFDDALPAAECELLARRVASDPRLRRQWSRYAVVGAALRGDPICVGNGAGSVADRVWAALEGEAEMAIAAEPERVAAAGGGRSRWTRPLAATGIAASVAALSLLWLQRAPGGEQPAQMLTAAAPSSAAGAAAVEVVTPVPALVASNAVGAQTEVVLAPALSGEPESYVVPALPASTPRLLSSTQLANFVVAHSEFSGSLARRSVLSALVAGEAAAPPATASAPQPDAAAVVEEP
jgi:negative regulator of sigma E activity